MRLFFEWLARNIDERCEIVEVDKSYTIQDLLTRCLALANVDAPHATLLLGAMPKSAAPLAQRKAHDLTLFKDNPASDVLRENDTIYLDVGQNAVWLQQGVLTSSDPWITNTAPSDLFVIEHLLTVQECKLLIEVSEDAGYALIDYNSAYRSNTRVQIQNKEFAAVLFERVCKFMPRFEDWEVCGLNAQFRFCRYEPGQDFKQHVDGVFDESPSCKSFFTLNIYLNQEFEGGATRFFDDPTDRSRITRSIQPQTGLALVFDHRHKSYVHDGEEVTGGRKYLLRTDVMYRSKKKT